VESKVRLLCPSEKYPCQCRRQLHFSSGAFLCSGRSDRSDRTGCSCTAESEMKVNLNFCKDSAVRYRRKAIAVKIDECSWTNIRHHDGQLN
jgi:hypothetical protein